MLLEDQWRNSWSELGVAITPTLLQDLEDILARYSEPHRKYHTVRHLEECFVKLAEVRDLAQHPAEVEIALWFHDAIYDTRSNQNEAGSAELARAKVLAVGGTVESAARIAQLIMATRHDAVPDVNDAEVLVDVDLSILGAPSERLMNTSNRFERSIPGFLSPSSGKREGEFCSIFSRVPPSSTPNCLGIVRKAGS